MSEHVCTTFRPDEYGYVCVECGEMLVEDDEYNEENEPDEFEQALSECGIGRDGYCSMAGSEFCDWDCPLERLGYFDNDESEQPDATS